jgi:acyl-coenzyme A thioesterase PaaI-like protein
MAESLKSRMFRLWFNFFPAYRGSGGRVTYIADDFREIRVKIPLSWRTRNYVGTIYGGSMYSAVDPIYMLMLIRILGPEYVVWDKAAKIRFRKPGKGTLNVEFRITDEEIDEIKRLAGQQRSVDRVYDVELKDKDGTLHASVEKTLYIAKKGNK